MASGNPKRIIRIFISSTFRDFKEERDTLSEEVFPDLRSLCEANGFSFHPIDLRWGVSFEDSSNNIATRICLEEIERCKELSPDINFFIMAGSCYGWQPLPEQIDNKVWTKLSFGLFKGSQEDKLLHIYYQQDKNDISKPYCLMPRPYIDRFVNHEEADDVVRHILNDLLDRARFSSNPIPRQTGGAQAGKTGSVGDAGNVSWDILWHRLKWQYNASATEQEITLGFFDEDEKARYNTFILLKGERAKENTGKEKASAEDPAEKLRRHIEDTVAGSGNSLQVYHKRTEGDTGWIEAARKFLSSVIRKEIERYQYLDQWGWEQDILRETFRYVNAHYIALPSAPDAEQYLNDHTGETILFTGGSGSGKSWFLKHYTSAEQEKGKIVCAVFNDVEPGGQNFIPALEMLVRSLLSAGVLEGETDSPDPENPVGWFENILRGIKQTEPVLLILDSINVQNMADYKNTIGKSLFDMVLPPCVTLVVSAVSAEDLREVDKKAQPQRYRMPRLEPMQRIDLLDQILSRQGRKLTESAAHPQRSMMEKCLQISSDLDSALAIEILAQVCMKLHSWDDFPFPGIIDFRDLVGFALFRQDREEYRMLRAHALGYLALSTIGLTEPEIIDLLSEDEDVVREIRTMTRKNGAIWDFEGQIPTVLWAILYADLKPFLIEINDEGMILLQLRHVRLREEILGRLGSVVQRKLLFHMRQYDRTQNWLLYSRDKVLPNRRKVQECFPIYEKLGDMTDLASFVRNPVCVDAFVRSRERTRIKEYLLLYGKSTISAQMFSALRAKELLFRLWPDCFVPASISALTLDPNTYRDWQKKRNILMETGCQYYIEGNRNSSGGAFFSELSGQRCCFALSARGLVAVLMNGMIRIIDLPKQEFLLTQCPSVKELCIMYWHAGRLIVRCEKRRLHYSFHNDQLTFEGEDKNVPDWGGYIRNDSSEVQQAGGWEEADYFGLGSDVLGSSVAYHSGSQIIRQNVYERHNYSFRAQTHGTLAAITLDEKRILVCDLQQRVKLLDERMPGITDVQWSESGKAILLVIGGNTLWQIAIDPSKPIGPMARPTTDYLHYKMTETGGGFIADWVRTWQSIFVRNPGVMISPDGPSEDIPLFGALSRKYGWAACYLFTDAGPIIRVLDMRSKMGEPDNNTGRFENIRGITWKDCREDPFHTVPGQNGLVMFANGKPVFFDMDKMRVAKLRRSAILTNQVDKEAEVIRGAYAEYVAKNLHLSTGEWPSGKGKSVTEQIKAILPYHRLCYADVLKECNRRPGNIVYWLIDKDNGLVHAFDESGKCLCRDMMASSILAADLDPEDGRLYLLLRTRDIISISLLSPEHEPA